ncbi:MAG TPA: hypothetical protein VHG89_00505 [Verrucomicrobiae bacterium]|nr:hypothetical protein [Verrucomicrobiae bacterium]
MNKIRSVYFCLFISLTFLCFRAQGQATITDTVFTLDPARSFLVITGNLAGVTFAAQGTGALSNTFSGTLDVELVYSSTPTIQLFGGTNIIANVNGNWQPQLGGAAGTAPGNYGVVAHSVPVGLTIPGDVYATLRNAFFDLESVPLPITGDNFNCAGSYLALSEFDFDYIVYTNNQPYVHGEFTKYVIPGGQTYFPNFPNLTGSLTFDAGSGIQTLVVPINVELPYTLLQDEDSAVTFVGQIVATRNLYAVSGAPVINSIAVSGQNIVLTTINTSMQSKLLVSTDLINWSAVANATITSGNTGTIIFTVPVSGPKAFYRVQQ